LVARVLDADGRRAAVGLVVVVCAGVDVVEDDVAGVVARIE
jgi:hypothetical protein